MEDTHNKKAVGLLASSVIKNVLSKKMQFEQERKMERGEIRDPQRIAPSPGLFGQQDAFLMDPHREKASRRGSLPPRQSSKHSEVDSDNNTIVCVDELGDIVDSGSCDTRSNKSERRGQRDEAPFSLPVAPDTNLEPPANEAGIDTKKGALELDASAKSTTLLRSQNSAFRSWRDDDGDDDDDGQLELPREHSHKNHKTAQGKQAPSSDETDLLRPDPGDGNKRTKMSHLFVPTIQLLSDGGEEVGQQLPNMNYMNYSTRAAAAAYQGEGGGGGVNTLYVADSRSVVTSKSPEIKINLRSVRDNKHDPFTVSKLRPAPCGSARVTDDFRCQALAAALKGECLDSKIPHFTVRDIRDNSGSSKGKLQTPIHQVRDVRKLVKSSYHFVSLDNNAASSSAATAADLHLLHAEPKKQQGPNNRNLSVSPIVIKCQSVNTNSNGKQPLTDHVVESKCGLHDEPFDLDRSSPEGAKSGSAPPHRSLGNTNTAGDSAEGGTDLKTEAKTASKRQEKITSITDKKSESKMATSALEKLQAAVKTMEQLYVFDRNEWKRKSEPRPGLTDSHLLSLMGDGCASPVEEGAGGCGVLPPSNLDMFGRRDSYPGLGRTPPASAGSPATLKREAREMPRSFQSPVGREERLGTRSLSTGSKNMFNLTSGQTAPTSAVIKAPQPRPGTQSPYSSRVCAPQSPKLPVSLKITQTKQRTEARDNRGGGETERSRPFSASADAENYLTIPVKSHAGGNNNSSSSRESASARVAQEKTSVYTFKSQAASPPGAPPGWPGALGYRRQDESRQSPQRSSIVMETRSPDTPTATIYHHPLPLNMASSQPQVYCFSPTMTPAFSPTMTPAPAMDPFQPTQRKMLLDPTTGNFYLVDTPVQQATRRLFDPETGQYVDVPMPQQTPMTMPPMTMSPMPMSPLAMSPTGAYGHTYMIYPGFMPTPAMIPARTLSQAQMSAPSDEESGEKTASAGPSEGMYMESPYYLATGKSPHMSPFAQQQQQQQQQHHVGATRTPQGFSGGAKQPVISITSQQQGPRIIAPPSFDGTTMSFVVEHR